VVVIVDVVSKTLVVDRLEHRVGGLRLGPVLTLEVSRNSGAAFSFAQGATVVFTLVAVAVVVVIIRTASRLRSSAWALTLGLLLGGAVGNLLDRLLRAPGPGRGAVVDFIHVPHFAVFNAADSAITVGAVLAVLLSLRGLEVDGTRRSSGQR
jgi:signal peptidase II